MPARAFFGPPNDGFVSGGAHISVYLVPVYRGRLVVFDVQAREARGRWLPWDILDFGANPYETASALADEWCGVALSDLSLVDVMSFPVEGGGWELTIVFRAELDEGPRGDDARTPFVFAPGVVDAIGPFDAVDLQRWIDGPAAAPARPHVQSPPAEQPGLLF